MTFPQLSASISHRLNILHVRVCAGQGTALEDSLSVAGRNRLDVLVEFRLVTTYRTGCRGHLRQVMKKSGRRPVMTRQTRS